MHAGGSVSRIVATWSPRITSRVPDGSYWTDGGPSLPGKVAKPEARIVERTLLPRGG